MLDTKKTKKIAALRGTWVVSELVVSYKPERRTGVIIKNSLDANEVFKQMWDLGLINLQEQFCCLFLNAENEVIAFRVIQTGNLTGSEIDLNFVMLCAFACHAKSVIFARNNPTGRLKEYYPDIDITRRIFYMLRNNGIKLIDLMIITQMDYYSYLDKGKMPKF